MVFTARLFWVVMTAVDVDLVVGIAEINIGHVPHDRTVDAPIYFTY